MKFVIFGRIRMKNRLIFEMFYEVNTDMDDY